MARPLMLEHAQPFLGQALSYHYDPQSEISLVEGVPVVDRPELNSAITITKSQGEGADR
jgi:hypothetical protein